MQCSGGSIKGAPFTATASPKPGSAGSATGIINQNAKATNGQAGTCSITASDGGAVTAQITWNGGSANTPAPPAAIVEETSTAVWGGTVGDSPDFVWTPDPTAGLGSGVSVTGAGSDTQYTFSNGSGYPSATGATGTKYSAATSGQSTTTTCSPSFVLKGTTGVNSDSYEYCTMQYTYTATAFPVTMSLGGTTPDSSGNLNILVGQRCTASLVGIPNNCTVSGYNWTVSGTKFQAWSPYPPSNFIGPVNPNGSFYVDGPGPLTNPTAHWYWNEAAGTETVKCTATVTPPSGQGAPFSVTATQQVSVANPTYACTHSEGVVAVIDGGQTLKAYPSDNSGHGETWYCNVLTPALFGGGGSCNFSQIITPGRSHTYSTGAVPCTENGKSGLDTLSPYPAGNGDPYTVGTGANAGWPADNSKHQSGDSPGTGLSDSKLGVCASVSITESFNTFLIYLPPGSDAQPVPLHQIDWNWNATVSEPPGGWASANMTAVGPSLTSTASARAYAHPQWIRVESPAVGSGW